MKKIFLLSMILIVTVQLSYSQILSKRAFRFENEPPPELKSNSITDIVVIDENTIWLGTGKGLSKTEDGGVTWRTYTDEQGLGKGGVSALAIKDSVIWVATAFDTLVMEEHVAAGGGLSFSKNYGLTWTHIPQPEPGGDWTIIDNVTYDIAIMDSAIWIASFGGGLMKSLDMDGKNWIVRPPDAYNFNPDEYLNHRVFSLLAVGDSLWVGTAEGINISYDAGRTWETQFTHQNQDLPISGNFVVAIALQEYQEKQVIWAATINAEGTDEVRAISRTENNGLTWETFLEGKFTYGFGFYGNEIYAATDSGLWKSPDGGENWEVFPQIIDADGREKLYTMEYYAADVTPNNVLWVGTSDGLAITSNNGLEWQILRAFVKPGEKSEARVYAYPNPFSPLRFNQFGGDGFIRFQFNTKSPTRATIRIFDFAMDLITSIDGGSWAGNQDCSVAWNCRDGSNHLLANGTYFYQLDLEGDGKHWGKIVIID
jgi:ligand-binding sensor domain-containing protein